MRKKKNLAKLLRSTGHTSPNQVWPNHSEISRKPKIYSRISRELITMSQYYLASLTKVGASHDAVTLFSVYQCWLGRNILGGFQLSDMTM